MDNDVHNNHITKVLLTLFYINGTEMKTTLKRVMIFHWTNQNKFLLFLYT